jgi:hypothetical protein
MRSHKTEPRVAEPSQMQAKRPVSLGTAIPILGLLKMTLSGPSCASLRKCGAAGEALRPSSYRSGVESVTCLKGNKLSASLDGQSGVSYAWHGDERKMDPKVVPEF